MFLLLQNVLWAGKIQPPSPFPINSYRAMPEEKKPSNSPSLPTGMGRKSNKPASSAPRGFAAMDPAQQRLIASQGGKASHASGRGHKFTPTEARVAGRKGGQVLGKRRKPDDTPSATD